MYYFILSIPFVVLATGTLLLLLPKKSRSRRLGVCLAVIGGVVGLVMVSWTLTYPTSERRDAQEHLLFNSRFTEVRSITIDPTYNDDAHSEYNLVDSSVTFTNADPIKQVLQALQQAQPFSPNHPGAIWSCLLTINSNDDSVSIVVDDTKSLENGVVVYLWSHRTQGWLVAEYRCDLLGAVLERLVHENATNRK